MLLHNAFGKAFVVVVAMGFASSTAAAAALSVDRRLGTPKSSNKTKSRANAAPTAKKHNGRSNLTVAALVGDDRYPGYAYPLKKCQGDCDSDDDCELGLFCQQRFSNESVAGCTGLRTAAMNEVDICYDPDDRLVFNMTFAANATLVRVGNNLEPAAAFPLQKCQGDCDDDSDCDGWLECFQREAPVMAVPGCVGVSGDASTDYCVDPNDVLVNERGKFLVDKGSDWVPAKAYPLGVCEGDCDSDHDCAGDLVCFQRHGERPVPSCQGVGSYSTDYCIRPEDDIDSVPPVPNAFRLKLYWERGYDWQYEFWEQEWCMRCDNVTCNAMDLLYTYSCTGKSTWFQFANRTNQATNVQVAQTDLCIQIDSFNDARLMTCNATESLQRFSSGDGQFNTKKFELRMQDYCLAQDHHPKAAEQLFLQECYKTVYSRTNFWTKY